MVSKLVVKITYFLRFHARTRCRVFLMRMGYLAVPYGGEQNYKICRGLSYRENNNDINRSQLL